MLKSSCEDSVQLSKLQGIFGPIEFDTTKLHPGTGLRKKLTRPQKKHGGPLHDLALLQHGKAFRPHERALRLLGDPPIPNGVRCHVRVTETAVVLRIPPVVRF